MRIASVAPAVVWTALAFVAGCGLSAEEAGTETASSSSGLSTGRGSLSRSLPAMRPPKVQGPRVSCEQNLQLPSRSATTATCTVQGSESGTVDFEIRGSSPGFTARALTQTGVLEQGGSLSFTLGINAPEAAAPGSVMIQARHASGWISELPIELTPTANRPSVHVVYLVPSDRQIDPNIVLGLDRAMRHVQIWTGAHAGKGRALVFASDPAADFQQSVIALKTSHPASWYSEAGAGQDGGAAWRARVLHDAQSLTGAVPGEPTNAWVFAMDAESAYGTGKATGGIALLASTTLRSLAGAQPSSETTCEAVGKLGQAALLASGLTPSTTEPDSLTADGWKSYPAATLTQDEQAAFADSMLVSEVDVTQVLFSCDWQSP